MSLRDRFAARAGKREPQTADAYFSCSSRTCAADHAQVARLEVQGFGLGNVGCNAAGAPRRQHVGIIGLRQREDDRTRGRAFTGGCQHLSCAWYVAAFDAPLGLCQQVFHLRSRRLDCRRRLYGDGARLDGRCYVLRRNFGPLNRTDLHAHGRHVGDS